MFSWNIIRHLPIISASIHHCDLPWLTLYHKDTLMHCMCFPQFDLDCQTWFPTLPIAAIDWKESITPISPGVTSNCESRLCRKISTMCWAWLWGSSNDNPWMIPVEEDLLGLMSSQSWNEMYCSHRVDRFGISVLMCRVKTIFNTVCALLNRKDLCLQIWKCFFL